MRHDVLSWSARAGGIVASLVLTAAASAQDTCGLCARQVVINSELATCFLDQYDQIAKADSDAIVVDLSGCASRGIVEALPSPNKAPAEPDVQFIVSRPQLACLKKQLEAPGVVLDPSATIELDACK